jgi:hypothetical protein
MVLMAAQLGLKSEYLISQRRQHRGQSLCKTSRLQLRLLGISNVQPEGQLHVLPMDEPGVLMGRLAAGWTSSAGGEIIKRWH